MARIVLIVFQGSVLNERRDGAMNSQPPMKRKRKLTLSTFDDRRLDGLNFCHQVYELFNQTRAGTAGIANLRLRTTKLEKLLIEELKTGHFLSQQWTEECPQVTCITEEVPRQSVGS
jgi:hypothetical protein